MIVDPFGVLADLPFLGLHHEHASHRIRLIPQFQRSNSQPTRDQKCVACVVLYAFRHTWATNAIVSGLDAATVAELMGTSIRMINEHYGHLAKHKGHMVNAAAKVSQFAMSEKSQGQTK
jgi:integrase